MPSELVVERDSQITVVLEPTKPLDRATLSGYAVLAAAAGATLTALPAPVLLSMINELRLKRYGVGTCMFCGAEVSRHRDRCDPCVERLDAARCKR